MDFSINIPPWCGIKVSSLAIHVTVSDREQVRLSSSSISSGMGSIVSGEYCFSFTLIDHRNSKNKQINESNHFQVNRKKIQRK